MKNFPQIKSVLLVSFCLTVLVIPKPSMGVETLEGVFESSIYGAGIGASLGLATWFITEEKRAKVLWSGILRGSALGALFGVGYGFLEKEGLFKSSGRNGKPQGYLFSWDTKEKSISFEPTESLRLISLSVKKSYSLNLFQAKF